jgi:hypothetical protein
MLSSEIPRSSNDIFPPSYYGNAARSRSGGYRREKKEETLFACP